MSAPSPSTVTVLRDNAGVARAVRYPKFSLKAQRGPDKGWTYTGAAAQLVLGTGEAAGARLTDPAISALHCEIAFDGNGACVRDLGSKNGLWFADRQVSELRLQDADSFCIGQTTLVFRLGDAAVDSPLASESSFGGLIGSSVTMRHLFAQLARAARTDATLLLRGETGTGKELAARAVAHASARGDRPFVVLDCSCLPPDLMENEVFGHETGAFSGASNLHRGAFERAHGGTLFLDEVGELPLPSQVKLLGVLQRQEFHRLGGTEPVKVDVRVIAATHRPLEKEVNAGRFRADLYYRLSTLALVLPPLRERREDIPALIGHFLRELGAALEPEALEELVDADYPGNVRQLRSAVERAILGIPQDEAALETSPFSFDLNLSYSEQKARLNQRFERAYLKVMLEATGGNVAEAARRSGLCRQHVFEMLKKTKKAT